MKFCDRLKELRAERGISQQVLSVEVSRLAGYEISQQRVAHYEQDYNQPSLEDVGFFADYFSVSVDYLIGRSNIRTPLVEFEEYKLNPTEKTIVDIVRSYPDEYAESVMHLLQIGVRYKR